MPNHKDIFRNKLDFSREEFTTELYKPLGMPRPREKKSQKVQYAKHDFTHKSLKRQMHEKDGRDT
ncbi:hypothetical protein [Effusibacillus lacus]|uniref:Uncharacterized protein n=1 Tax=Effusibacillus lacus TaxID=1348429 RepID=A0A292YTN3_9BACL|nr:hypothetical protein [Effusibacillus lacus]TCS76245.1 hypothetical protein EDD64_1039 [Effusibacillus lacus]GAX91794.1 hypothetical protein EFBL_3485 [Effusibacillus lacus]